MVRRSESVRGSVLPLLAWAPGAGQVTRVGCWRSRGLSVEGGDRVADGGVHRRAELGGVGVVEDVAYLADVAGDEELHVLGGEVGVEPGEHLGGGDVDGWHGLGVAAPGDPALHGMFSAGLRDYIAQGTERGARLLPAANTEDPHLHPAIGRPFWGVPIGVRSHCSQNRTLPRAAARPLYRTRPLTCGFGGVSDGT